MKDVLSYLVESFPGKHILFREAVDGECLTAETSFVVLTDPLDVFVCMDNDDQFLDTLELLYDDDTERVTFQSKSFLCKEATYTYNTLTNVSKKLFTEISSIYQKRTQKK